MVIFSDNVPTKCSRSNRQFIGVKGIRFTATTVVVVDIVVVKIPAGTAAILSYACCVKLSAAYFVLNTADTESSVGVTAIIEVTAV